MASEQTGSLIDKKQAELIESLSSAANTFVVGTTPLKKSGLACTIVGRASNSLLFNKKYDSVKGNETILSETKGNLVCQSLEEQSQHSLSMEGCSSERPAVVNLSNGIKASKQENNSPLITPADISNSGKLVENATSASDSKFLQSIFTTLEEAPLIRNKVTTEGGVTLVQVQKRPARGLVAMLGPSKWKQKNEMSSKVYDTEQGHGLASENNNSKVLGIAGQTEEISSLVGDQYGEVHVLCNSSDKKIIGKQMKLHDKARLVN